MRTPSPLLAASGLLALALLAAPGLASAQNASGGGTGATSQATDLPKTGVGPRGTKVGPSTDPGLQPQQSGNLAAGPETDKTGVGPRGTKVGPSTNPSEPNPQQQ